MQLVGWVSGGPLSRINPGSNRRVTRQGGSRYAAGDGLRRTQTPALLEYRFGAIYIKFVGTHQQYDAIDANTVEME